MRSAKNMVDKIFLDFTYKVNGNNKPNAIEKTQSIFYDNLLPKIDLLLSKHSNNSTIRIDSLTIDLEKTSLSDLTDKLLSELEKEIAKHLSNRPWTAFRPDDAPDKQHDDLDTLVYFLQTGSLPWYRDKNILPGEVFNRTIKKNKAKTLHKLKQTFVANNQALERFILQFPAQQAYKLYSLLISENAFAPLLTVWYQFVEKKQLQQVLRTFLFAMKHATVTNENDFLNEFVKVLVLPYLNADNEVLPLIVAELQNLPSKNILVSEYTMFFKKIAKKHSATSNNVGSDNPDPQSADATPPENTQATKQNFRNTEAEKTSFAVDNAGLVILFPYLQMFFSEIRLIKDDHFLNKTAQLKAVQMLQFLATGSSKTPEHLLALNKVLCGIDMAVPCPGTLRLTKVQKQMCETLLSAVINNWPPVKGTSVAGFQQSFLQRNGTLRRDDENWTLYVERKAFDILLEQLPWGFSVVKFPWTENFIHVLW